jgi:lipopolysaccharide/colanic/teichoic acid biosynthesis glycosyltransferase
VSRYLRHDRRRPGVAAVLLVPCRCFVLGWWSTATTAVLFISCCVGRDGAELPMWKLRSMRRGRMSAGSAPGMPSDTDRSTVACFHLDELPQLVNVVRGEMALLGPRPEAPEYVETDDPGWRDVLSAPPGIAGPTQLVVGDWERDIITAAPDGSAYIDQVVPVKVAIDRWYVKTLR